MHAPGTQWRLQWRLPAPVHQPACPPACPPACLLSSTALHCPAYTSMLTPCACRRCLSPLLLLLLPTCSDDWGVHVIEEWSHTARD